MRWLWLIYEAERITELPRRYFLLNTTLPVLMCGYLALLVLCLDKASLEARIGASPVAPLIAIYIRTWLCSLLASMQQRFPLCAIRKIQTDPAASLTHVHVRRRHGHAVPQPNSVAVRDERNISRFKVSSSLSDA